MKSKQAKITSRVPKSLAKHIAAQAASRGCSRSALIADILQKAIGKEIDNKRKHLAAVDNAIAAIRTSHPEKIEIRLPGQLDLDPPEDDAEFDVPEDDDCKLPPEDDLEFDVPEDDPEEDELVPSE
jgi:hypothetical protein